MTHYCEAIGCLAFANARTFYLGKYRWLCAVHRHNSSTRVVK